jgi:hypothetical protein
VTNVSARIRAIKTRTRILDDIVIERDPHLAFFNCLAKMRDASLVGLRPL